MTKYVVELNGERKVLEHDDAKMVFVRNQNGELEPYIQLKEVKKDEKKK